MELNQKYEATVGQKTEELEADTTAEKVASTTLAPEDQNNIFFQKDKQGEEKLPPVVRPGSPITFVAAGENANEDKSTDASSAGDKFPSTAATSDEQENQTAISELSTTEKPEEETKEASDLSTDESNLSTTPESLVSKETTGATSETLEQTRLFETTTPESVLSTGSSESDLSTLPPAISGENITPDVPFVTDTAMPPSEIHVEATTSAVLSITEIAQIESEGLLKTGRFEEAKNAKSDTETSTLPSENGSLEATLTTNGGEELSTKASTVEESVSISVEGNGELGQTAEFTTFEKGEDKLTTTTPDIDVFEIPKTNPAEAAAKTTDETFMKETTYSTETTGIFSSKDKQTTVSTAVHGDDAEASLVTSVNRLESNEKVKSEENLLVRPSTLSIDEEHITATKYTEGTAEASSDMSTMTSASEQINTEGRDGIDVSTAAAAVQNINTENSGSIDGSPAVSATENSNAEVKDSVGVSTVATAFQQINTEESGSVDMSTAASVVEQTNTEEKDAVDVSTAATAVEQINTEESGSVDMSTAASVIEQINAEEKDAVDVSTAATAVEQINTEERGSEDVSTATSAIEKTNTEETGSVDVSTTASPEEEINTEGKSGSMGGGRYGQENVFAAEVENSDAPNTKESKSFGVGNTGNMAPAEKGADEVSDIIPIVAHVLLNDSKATHEQKDLGLVEEEEPGRLVKVEDSGESRNSLYSKHRPQVVMEEKSYNSGDDDSLQGNLS